jgi:integrase
MGVYLREKKIGNGQISFYLDIYHNKSRWYEFLEIHINKKNPTPEDKDKKRLAKEIRSKRENELIVQDNGLIDKGKKKGDFVAYYANSIKTKDSTHFASALSMLKRYWGKKSLPFTAVTAFWIKGFTDFMLTQVSNNTTRCYLMDIFTVLEEAVRAKIIPSNPMREIEKHERIKQKDVFRKAYTIEELQLLANTPCKMPKQVRQGYFFSCSTGLRWSDLNPLKWDEIQVKQIDNEERYFIYFEQEKTEGIEYIPLGPQAVEILKEREREAKEAGENSPYVFPDLKEQEGTTKRWQVASRSIRRWAKAAGLDAKRMTFHTSRHTFATNILENSPDADLYTVSKLLGHKTIHATQIYAKVRDSKKLAAVRALPMLDLKLDTTKVA